MFNSYLLVTGHYLYNIAPLNYLVFNVEAQKGERCDEVVV